MPKPTPTHCKDCSVELTENVSSYGRDYKRNQCRNCYNKYFRERNRLNPKRQRDAVRKSNYGITGSQYDEMVHRQGGVCAICHQSDDQALSVDHDHSTNEIRGLLCGDCNRALGLVRENTTTLMNMIEYLRNYQERYQHNPLKVVRNS